MTAFIANLLSTLAQNTGGLGMALLETAVVFRICLIPIFQTYYKSTLLADVLQEKVDKIYAGEKKSKKALDKVTKLMVSTGYPSLGMLTYTLLVTVVGVILILPLFSGGAALHLNGASKGFGTFLQDITVVPFAVVTSGIHDFNTLTVCFVLPFAVGASTYYHDRVFAKHTLVVRNNFDTAVLLGSIAASAFLPLGFGIYWCVAECIGMLQAALVRKFSHVTIKEKG